MKKIRYYTPSFLPPWLQKELEKHFVIYVQTSAFFLSPKMVGSFAEHNIIRVYLRMENSEKYTNININPWWRLSLSKDTDRPTNTIE